MTFIQKGALSFWVFFSKLPPSLNAFCLVLFFTLVIGVKKSQFFWPCFCTNWLLLSEMMSELVAVVGDYQRRLRWITDYRPGSCWCQTVLTVKVCWGAWALSHDRLLHCFSQKAHASSLNVHSGLYDLDIGSVSRELSLCLWLWIIICKFTISED